MCTTLPAFQRGDPLQRRLCLLVEGAQQRAGSQFPLNQAKFWRDSEKSGLSCVDTKWMQVFSETCLFQWRVCRNNHLWCVGYKVIQDNKQLLIQGAGMLSSGYLVGQVDAAAQSRPLSEVVSQRSCVSIGDGHKPGRVNPLPVLAGLLLLIALHCRSPNWYPKYEFHLPLSFPDHFGICNPHFTLLLLWRKAKQAGDPDYVLEKQLNGVGNAAKTWKAKGKDESGEKK